MLEYVIWKSLDLGKALKTVNENISKVPNKKIVRNANYQPTSKTLFLPFSGLRRGMLTTRPESRNRSINKVLTFQEQNVNKKSVQLRVASTGCFRLMFQKMVVTVLYYYIMLLKQESDFFR